MDTFGSRLSARTPAREEDSQSRGILCFGQVAGTGPTVSRGEIRHPRKQLQQFLDTATAIVISHGFLLLALELP